MENESLIEDLKKNNLQLEQELQELHAIIEWKEEELSHLKKTSQQVVEMQSKFDLQIYELEQMQSNVESLQKNIVTAARRENAYEQELLESIERETAYYTLKEEFASTQAALKDFHQQMDEVTELNKQVADLKSRVASLESHLEIAMLENGFLKEDLKTSK
jgi:hypothetical protein